MSTDSDDFIVVPLNEAGGEAEKKFIRTHILGQSNEALVNDPQAMQVLKSLGSDMNINAFACNFRINGKANTDVEEANYLNNAVFKRLSITTPNVRPETIPMFLSSTTFSTAGYGECVRHFKERLELETESDQDLFVLRNVVMSPFQTAGDFVQKIADIFQGVLVEEMQVRRVLRSRRYILSAVYSTSSSGTRSPRSLTRSCSRDTIPPRRRLSWSTGPTSTTPTAGSRSSSVPTSLPKSAAIRTSRRTPAPSSSRQQRT